MPLLVPPHRIRIRRQPGPEPRSISVFGIFRKAVFCPDRPQPLRVNSNPRRTCNTRTGRRQACSAGTRAAANKPGNNGTDLRTLRLPACLQGVYPRATLQQPGPTSRLRPSPAFHPVSQPSGYSTTRREQESARGFSGFAGQGRTEGVEDGRNSRRILQVEMIPAGVTPVSRITILRFWHPGFKVS
jgi:hypothetical protein